MHVLQTMAVYVYSALFLVSVLLCIVGRSSKTHPLWSDAKQGLRMK